jgi:hypothetical protein
MFPIDVWFFQTTVKGKRRGFRCSGWGPKSGKKSKEFVISASVYDAIYECFQIRMCGDSISAALKNVPDIEREQRERQRQETLKNITPPN